MCPVPENQPFPFRPMSERGGHAVLKFMVLLMVVVGVVVGFFHFVRGKKAEASSGGSAIVSPTAGPVATPVQYPSINQLVDDMPKVKPAEVRKPFSQPVPDGIDSRALYLQTMPLRVLAVFPDCGSVWADIGDGEQTPLTMSGLSVLEKGDFFRVVEIRPDDGSQSYVRAEKVQVSDVDFETGKFAPGTEYRKAADALEFVRP